MPYALGAGKTTIHYRDWGAGRNVVLVHGDNVDSQYWQYQIAVLGASGCRVVAVDRRGHGLSEYTSTGYDVESYAEDLHAVLLESGIADAILIGHSTGASTVARYLARYGTDRVAGVVLAAMAKVHAISPTDNIGLQYLQQAYEAVLNDRPAYYSSLSEAFFGQGVSSATVESFVQRCLTLPLEIALEEARFLAYPRNDVSEDLMHISVPTLIVHGDRDTFAPIEASAQIAHELIPGSRLELYVGASHGLTISSQERFTADILEFIRSFERIPVT